MAHLCEALRAGKRKEIPKKWQRLKCKGIRWYVLKVKVFVFVRYQAQGSWNEFFTNSLATDISKNLSLLQTFRTMAKLLETSVTTLPEDLPTMNNRIEFLRCTLGYPVAAFTTKVGSGPAALKNVLTGKRDPSISLLNNIVKIFPISREWLFLGKGQPFTVNDLSPYMYSKKGEKDESIDTEINERFREVRLDTGLSQVLFANELSLTKDIVASIESMRQGVSISILKKLARKFSVSEVWFLYGVGNKYKR